MLQRKQYFNEIKHIFIQFIEVFRPNHSNIKWLINRPCGTELVKQNRTPASQKVVLSDVNY